MPMSSLFRRRARFLHRVLGLVLVAPLLAWSATGLLFLVKPGWTGAFEPLDAMSPKPLSPSAFVSPNDLPLPTPMTRLELGATALGPVYRIRMGEETQLFDARSGRKLSPLDERAAAAVARDAARRSARPARYGDPVETTLQASQAKVRFSEGVVVAVGRSDLSLSQSGPDTDWINRFYALHYLRWTGVRLLDQVVAVVALVGVWALALAGLVLLRGRKSRLGPA